MSAKVYSQEELDALRTRTTVTDQVGTFKKTVAFDQKSRLEFTCGEKCSICCAEGCNGWLPCFAKKNSFIVYDFQKYIVSRLGKETWNMGPGYIEILNQGKIDQIKAKIDIRELCFEIPSQKVTTQDQIHIEVWAVCFYKIFDSVKVILNIKNAEYEKFVFDLVTSTLKSAIERHSIKEVFENDQIIQNSMKEESVDFQMRYGVQIIRVEITNIRILTNEWDMVR